MPDSGSITFWLRKLTEGDRSAVEHLWHVYFARLVGLSRKRLETSGMSSDAEDVVLSAFKSFCLRAEKGQFPDLADRHGLWETLVLLTTRKMANHVKHELRQKRDRRRLVPQADNDRPILADVIGKEPEPALAAEIVETFRQLMDCLENDEFRIVAQGKLEGYTNEEIASHINKSLPTVERRLKAIRDRWRQFAEENAGIDGIGRKELS